MGTLKTARVRLGSSLRRLLTRKVSDPRAEDYVQKVSERWSHGTAKELEFWKQWVDGTAYPGSFEERLRPDQPLQDFIVRWLDPAAPSVSILDVGAGPITVLGTSWPGHEVALSAVDVLGDDYAALLTEAGVEPPVLTLGCPTEELTARFERGQFDLVHAANTLDHHADVLGAIEAMLAVTRPGGHVVMRHTADEGERRRYRGLHQWNFRVEGSQFVIWNMEARTTLSEQFGDVMEIVELDGETPFADGVAAHAVMRKR